MRSGDIRDRFTRVEVSTRAAWRQWLEQRHGQSGSVWLVTWKQGRGPYIPYTHVRDEALCFGWIDSRPAKLDADRSMLLMSPRREGSRWSRVNKERVAALIDAGLMAPPGLVKIERAKADGTWEALDGVDALIVPDDLGRALAEWPPAVERFAAFPPSTRRGILEWIMSAKRQETRARRVQETARLAAEGVKANFPRSDQALRADGE